MEFHHNINEIFKSPIVEINHSLIPPGYTGDRRALRDVVSKVSEIVNTMGEASAAAQGLTKPITTADRLRNSEHKLYLLIDPNGNGSKGAVTGMLKTGNKSLYVFDRDGVHYQVSPPCLLDFYVHETRQRNGLGKQLFEHMLQKEQIEPVQMAIDRPSEKLLSFFNKHYSLNEPVKQMNNYVVYHGFFPSKQPVSQTPEVEEARSAADCKKNSANGLQYFQSPKGRYGAPRPPCSMGQIIHNQSPTMEQRQESTGVQPFTNHQDVNFSPQPNIYETKSAPNTYYGNHPANQYQSRSMTQQNWQQDPAQQQHNVYYQNQNYSLPGNTSNQPNPQRNVSGQYSHFMPDQSSQIHTTAQGSHFMPAQPSQIDNTPQSSHYMPAQPSQTNTTAEGTRHMSAQPTQMNTTAQGSHYMPAQPSQMNTNAQSLHYMSAQSPQFNTTSLGSHYMPTQPSQINASAQGAHYMSAQPTQMNTTSQGSHYMPIQPSQMNMTAQASHYMAAQPPHMNTTAPGSQYVPPQIDTNAHYMPAQASQIATIAQGSHYMPAQPSQMDTNAQSLHYMPAQQSQVDTTAQGSHYMLNGYQYQQPAVDYSNVQYATPTSLANDVSSSKQKLNNGMDLPEPKPKQQQHKEGVASSGNHLNTVVTQRQEPLISYSQDSRMPEQHLSFKQPHMTQSAVYPASVQNPSVQGFATPHITHTAPNLNVQQYTTVPYVEQAISQSVSRNQTPTSSLQQMETQSRIVQEKEDSNHVMGAGEPKQIIHSQHQQPQYQMYNPQAQATEAGDFKQQMIPAQTVRHENVKPVASKTDATPYNSKSNVITPEQNFPYTTNSAEINRHNFTQQNYPDNQEQHQITPVQTVPNETSPVANQYPQKFIQPNHPNQPVVNSGEEYHEDVNHVQNSPETLLRENPQSNFETSNDVQQGNIVQENMRHLQRPTSSQPYFYQSNQAHQNLTNSQQHFQHQNVQQPEYAFQQNQNFQQYRSQIYQNPSVLQQVGNVSNVDMNQGDYVQHGNTKGHVDQPYTVNQAGDYINQQKQEPEIELPKRRVRSAAELFKTNTSERQSTCSKAKRYYNKLIQPSECDLIYGYPPQINESRMSFIRQRS